jgi:hypothetical protein
MKKPEPVTKTDIDSLRKDIKLEAGLLREEFSGAFERYDEKNRGYRDEVLTGLDKVMKELETMREESTIGVYKTREIEEKMEDQEKRISKIESSQL